MNKTGSVQKKWMVAGLAGAVVAAAVLIFFLMSGKEDYRSIQVYEVTGTARVERAGVGTMDVYQGMMLQPEDTVSVSEESSLQLKLDDDKYVLLEPGTTISLQASGSSTDSRTTISLETGSIVNRLDNKLSGNAAYEVNTPNSTMAVRGTTFGIEVNRDDNGTICTLLSCYEGIVQYQPVYSDGTRGDVTMASAGMQVAAKGSGEASDFEVQTGQVDYAALDLRALEFLSDAVAGGKELSIPVEELQKLVEEKKENAGKDAEQQKDGQGTANDQNQQSADQQSVTDNEQISDRENAAGEGQTTGSGDNRDKNIQTADNSSGEEQKPAAGNASNAGQNLENSINKGQQTESGSVVEQEPADSSADEDQPDDDDEDEDQPSRPDDGNQSQPSKPDDGNQGQPSRPDDGNQNQPSKPDDGDQNQPSKPDDGDQDQPSKPDDGNQKYIVAFYYEGRVFAIQFVEKEGTACEPLLRPDSTGAWDFDFNTPITENTKINWFVPSEAM